jgi:hypothetical protein
VGHRAGLDVLTKRIISCPYRESNSDRPTRSLVTNYTDGINRLLIYVSHRHKTMNYVLPCMNPVQFINRKYMINLSRPNGNYIYHLL